MDNLLIAACHYNDIDAREILLQAFLHEFSGDYNNFMFVCIGSDRHMLDCLGPMAGTMIKEKKLGISVMGTLEKPVHARNLVNELDLMKRLYPDYKIIAIDASIGNNEETGWIKLKKGPLRPGKAVFKKLPEVGDYSITGLVGNRIDKKPVDISGAVSLASVYAMARVISDTIVAWDNINNQGGIIR